MEHRWSRRQPVNLDALVFHRLSGLLRASVCNISPEGAFIAGDHLALPSQSLVQLSVVLNIDRKRLIQEIDALVIHRARNGYGLMFKDFRLDAFL